MARIPKQERHDQVKEATADSSNLHILEMRVENIKRIKFAHIRPKGNVIIVAGKNGQGKSSVLDAIAWVLTGTSTVPRYPIRKGQRTGSVKVDIGDFIVTRFFTHVDEDRSEKGLTYLTKLVVTGKRGEAYPSPQVLLNQLLGKITFDPLAFMRMEDDEQLQELRGLVKFDIDIDALDAEQKTDYDSRREFGRTIDSLKNRIAALPAPDSSLPGDPLDVATLTEKLQNAAQHNSEVAKRRHLKTTLLEGAAILKAKAESLRDEVGKLLKEAQELDGLEAFTNFGVQGDGQYQKVMADAQALQVGDEIDTAEVAAELTRANQTNAAIQRAANFRQLQKELAEAEASWKDLDDRMKQRDEKRERAIESAQMPIDGLSIGHGLVMYQKLPLSQASNAEQIRVSMALGMAANPKLRVLRISDGSLLDDESLQLIGDSAKEHDFQVWIERVETGGKVSVIMEDGEATGDDVEVEK